MTYDATSGTFTATGVASSLDDGTTLHNFTVPGAVDVAATITSAGGLQPGGVLTFTGQVLGFGATNPLLTGDLTTLGFDNNSDVIEFLFSVSGGDLAPLYGGSAGVILRATGFLGNFNNDYENIGSFDFITSTIHVTVPISGGSPVIPEP